MVTTRPPKTIVKPTALGPVANTDTKLLIYGLFQKGRVLAQDGTVGPVRIIRSLDRGLDLKAIEAVRQWKFKPGLFQSKPVDVLAVITVDFTLL